MRILVGLSLFQFSIQMGLSTLQHYCKIMEHSLEYQSIIREIQISCDTFGGFKVDIDVALFSNKQQIIDWVINLLKVRLEDLNLNSLLNKLNNTASLYHIHDYEMGQILTENRTYYICNHDCNT